MATRLKAKKFYCSVPEYWALPPRRRPRTLEGLLKLVQRKAGIWCIQQINKITGEVEMMQICENCITDNGATSMWKNTMNASSAGIAVANIIAIDQSLGYTTLATTIASGGTVTSITVGSLTGPTIPSGTKLLIGAGGATTLLVQTSAAITGAGTYSVVSTAGPSSSIASGANIRYDYSAVPTTDVSSLSSPVAYTAALPSGQFTFSGTGNGNRQMQVTNTSNYVFSTTANSNPSVAPTANYTAGWLVNANPVTSTSNTFIHVVFDSPLPVSSTTTGTCQISEKV
jgi:hypothetical protein